ADPKKTGQGFYDTTLAVDPLDAGIVYAGGQADANSFLETTDGGLTWVDIHAGAGGADGPHADHHAIGFDAAGRLLDGNDGGLWRLDNPTPSNIRWTDLNGPENQALAITQFTGIALDPHDPKVFYGGSQDNGTEKAAGALAWDHTADGDGGFVRVDCANPKTVYHTFQYPLDTPDHKFLERSDDGGITWSG